MENDLTGRHPEEPKDKDLQQMREPDPRLWEGTRFGRPIWLPNPNKELPEVALAKTVAGSIRAGVEKTVTIFQAGARRAGEILHRPQREK